MDIKLAIAIREATEILPASDVSILIRKNDCRVWPEPNVNWRENRITIVFMDIGSGWPKSHVLCDREINEALALAAGADA